MNCNDIEQLQHAYIDQELDAANAAALAKHFSTCPSCARKIDELQVLSKAIKAKATRHTLPPELADKISGLTSANNVTRISSPKRWLPLQWGASGAALAMAACLAFLLILRPDEHYVLQQQLISSHVRSLQDGHLTDVISTDQHTVKPWFNGRLDASPPVVDLIANGFPLIGGRLDYVDHHSVAVIVYKYNAHILNLFVWPASHEIRLGTKAAQQGYNMRNWQDGDLQFWAVSDVNPTKLSEFEQLYRDQTKPK